MGLAGPDAIPLAAQVVGLLSNINGKMMEPAALQPLASDKQMPLAGGSTAAGTPVPVAAAPVFTESELLAAVTKELQLLREEVRELRKVEARVSDTEKRQAILQDSIDRLLRMVRRTTRCAIVGADQTNAAWATGRMRRSARPQSSHSRTSAASAASSRTSISQKSSLPSSRRGWCAL